MFLRNNTIIAWGDWMNYIQMLKTVVGVIVTILIAQFLHLDYAVSAGMITMLSILETKRQSFRVAFKRLVATLIGLLIAYILFNILGINLFVFGLIILVFLQMFMNLFILMILSCAG